MIARIAVSAAAWLFEPQSTLDPQSTLHPAVPALPQTTLEPHSTELPFTKTFEPQTTELPQRTLLPHSTDDPVTRVACPVAALKTAVGDIAEPVATSVFAIAAATSRYPAPTVKMS